MSLSAIAQYLVNLGPDVVLPVIIFIFGLAIRLPVGKAFRAALIIGVGFVGINLVIGLLGSSIGPAAQQMVQHSGVKLGSLDVGWPASAAIAYGSRVGALAIPVGLAVNILMLLTGLTKTLDVDLWNYWHIAFAGAIVTVVTHSYSLGLYAEVIAMILILTIADWSQPWVKSYFGYDNISFPHGTSVTYFVMALVLDKVFNMVPGFRNWDASPENLQKRFGVFGDSMVVGLIVGLLVAVLAGMPFSQTLTLGITVAAVMVILPRMVAMLMEGLVPIADGASSMLQRRFPSRKLFIGMDTALLVGAPATIAASVVLVPITLGLAFILPGNHTLPFIDLATIPFIIALMTPVFKGNVLKTIVAGTIVMIPTLYISTAMAPLITIAAKNVNFKMPSGSASITSLVDGGNLLPYVIRLAGGLGFVGLSVLFILSLVFAYIIRGVVRRRSLEVGDVGASQ